MIGEVYRWVSETRGGLLDYCDRIPQAAFAERRDDFGHGSLRGTLLHTAGCYHFWLARTVMGHAAEEFTAADYPDAAGIRTLFRERVDPLVEQFLAACAGSSEALVTPFSLRVRWQKEPFLASPLWLMTHVITHEFHHKGQIVAFGRMLGYPPPETDLYLPPGGA